MIHFGGFHDHVTFFAIINFFSLLKVIWTGVRCGYATAYSTIAVLFLLFFIETN